MSVREPAGSDRLGLSGHDVERRVSDGLSLDRQSDDVLGAESVEPEPAVLIGGRLAGDILGDIHGALDVVVSNPRRLAPLDSFDPRRQVTRTRPLHAADFHGHAGDRPSFEVDDPPGDRHVGGASLGGRCLDSLGGYDVECAQVDDLAGLDLQLASQLELLELSPAPSGPEAVQEPVGPRKTYGPPAGECLAAKSPLASSFTSRMLISWKSECAAGKRRICTPPVTALPSGVDEPAGLTVALGRSVTVSLGGIVRPVRGQAHYRAALPLVVHEYYCPRLALFEPGDPAVTLTVDVVVIVGRVGESPPRQGMYYRLALRINEANLDRAPRVEGKVGGE